MILFKISIKAHIDWIHTKELIRMDDHALFDELMKIHKNSRNFDLLVEDFKAGRIVPFIGAGFSIMGKFS